MSKQYLHWDEITTTVFSDTKISELYTKGYVFTRIGKGVVHQTRSVRIDLSKFILSSENKRILKKVPGLVLTRQDLPMTDYSYIIGKLAKDFYDTKFGPGIMSAQKVKEMLTDERKSNFNTLLSFTACATEHASSDTESSPPCLPVGRLARSSFSAAFAASERSASTCSVAHAICYKNSNILHYSYPFYDLNNSPKDMGLAMMTLTIDAMKNAGLKYVYLGSLQRPSDTYKLQFEGLEWFDGQSWSDDTDKVKEILKHSS